MTAQQRRWLGGHGLLLSPEYSRSTYSRSTACVLIFEAELPYSTSGSTNQQDITPRTISGGHTFNLTFDHTFGIIGTGGYVQINNEGSSATYPTFRIYGPIQFPKIENTDTGDYLELIITIQGGDYIEINTRTAEITINGSASRYYALTNDSRWFTLKPGKTILACSALYHASPAKLSTFWENAYRV